MNNGGRDLLILGSGVHAGEMAGIVARLNQPAPVWNLRGYVAADDRSAGGRLHGLPILPPRAAWTRHPCAALAASNEGGWRRRTDWPRRRLVSLIDPSVFVARGACFGRGCVFFPGGFIGLNARIGDFVFCLAGCVINHDCVIGAGTVMASGAILAGGVRVGGNCYLGQSCTVRQFLKIGPGSLLGLGTVVVKDVPPRSVMAGNPARRLRGNIIQRKK